MIKVGIPYLLSGPVPTSAVTWAWTWAVLLGAKETETNHNSPPPPPHAAGLPRWVRPACRDLLATKTIEKWVWLFYKTVGKEGSYLRWDYLTPGRVKKFFFERGKSFAGGMMWETDETRQHAWFIDRRGLVISFIAERLSERKKEGTPVNLKNEFSNLRKSIGILWKAELISRWPH